MIHIFRLLFIRSKQSFVNFEKIKAYVVEKLKNVYAKIFLLSNNLFRPWFENASIIKVQHMLHQNGYSINLKKIANNRIKW